MLFDAWSMTQRQIMQIWRTFYKVTMTRMQGLFTKETKLAAQTRHICFTFFIFFAETKASEEINNLLQYLSQLVNESLVPCMFFLLINLLCICGLQPKVLGSIRTSRNGRKSEYHKQTIGFQATFMSSLMKSYANKIYTKLKTISSIGVEWIRNNS